MVEMHSPREFDREFFTDLAIGAGILVLTLIPFEYEWAYIGSPIILLAGPLVGFGLCLYHRNPR